MATTTTTETKLDPSTLPTTTTATAPTDTPPYSWTKGPIPLIRTPLSLTSATDQFTATATEMSCVHNCIIRAFNSIYIQAPHIPPSEHTSFLHYCLAGYIGLAAHHDGEESFFFPELEKRTGEKGLMDANVSQHKDFHDGFEAWGNWLQAIQAGEESFSGVKCVELMDTFLAPLTTHLMDEIPTLLALSRFGDTLDLRALSKQEGDMVMGSLSKTAVLPMFFLNHDLTYEGGLHTGFPPIPGPVRWVLREGFGRWNREWWKFSTCGFDGRPRELPFLGEEGKGKEKA